MTYFKIQSVVFIEPAYIAGQARRSANTVDPGRGAGRVGPDTADEVLGCTPGVFVRTRGRWDFVGWGNVASAVLAGEPPGYGEKAAEPATAPEEDALLGLSRPAEPAPAVVYVGPAPTPGHVTATPLTGTRIVCSGCGASFAQGENHWCSDAGRLDR